MSDEIVIRLYDEIGSGGMSAKQFADDLEAAGDVRTIVLRINSPGGDAFAGVAMMNTLVNHDAYKIVHVDGVAASAATLPMLAGNEVNIAGNAMVMIHRASVGLFGNADDLKSTETALRKLDAGLASAYARRAGKPAAHFAAAMADETWYTAEEAVEAGLATRVTEEKRFAARWDTAAMLKYSRKPHRVEALAAALLRGAGGSIPRNDRYAGMSVPQFLSALLCERDDLMAGI